VWSATANLSGTSGQLTLGVVGNVLVSNALSTTNVWAATANLSGTTGKLTLGVVGNVLISNSVTTTNLYVSNIYTSNISGVSVGSSQWTGTAGQPITYAQYVGIGSSAVPTSNLQVQGNIWVSNSVTTTNLYVSNIYTSNISGVSVGSSQWSGTAGQPITYTPYVGIGSSAVPTSNLQVQGNIWASNALSTQSVLTGTLNAATINTVSFQTTSSIPSVAGLFMNLHATYTLNSTGNWAGDVAGTQTYNLYTLFAPDPSAQWDAYGTSSVVNSPTINGGIRFNQTGPYMFTVVISADNAIKTIALSSNTADVHTNKTNAWSYCFRYGVGTNPSFPAIIPINVTDTSMYYYLDIETTNQIDNIHQTAYTNASTQAYTGSYVMVRPV
jgi:hypothetical protein